MADEKPELESSLESTESDTAVSGADAPSAPELNPPASPPPLITEYHEHDGRRWPTILVYLVIALIAAALIALAARTIYRATHHANPVKNPPTNVPSPPGANPAKHNHKNAGSKRSNSNTGAVPNTGPGNTIALFIGVSLVVAGLHYVYQLRKTRE